MCSTGCATQDHVTWGECVRAKGLKIGATQSFEQKAWDRELKTYESARSQGIQPQGTAQHQIDAAVQYADRNGEAP